jgi:hypothetical protein
VVFHRLSSINLVPIFYDSVKLVYQTYSIKLSAILSDISGILDKFKNLIYTSKITHRFPNTNNNRFRLAKKIIVVCSMEDVKHCSRTIGTIDRTDTMSTSANEAR